MATPLTKRVTSEPVSKIEVHISCDKLMNKDVMSKSDPCCLLYVMSDGRWVEVRSSLSLCNILTLYLTEELRELSVLELDLEG